MTMPHTVDVTTPGDREVRVTRVFDAPRDLVYEAHTNPDLVRRWMLGPPGWTMPVCEIDLRVGGRYHYVWREENGEGQFGTGGEFREIDAPGRIVHTERPDWAEDGEALCTLTLTEADGRTMLVQTMLFSSAEVRDQVLATGMTDGMAQSYDRLERMLAAPKAA